MTWHQIAKAALEGQSVSHNPNGTPERGYLLTTGETLTASECWRDRRNHCRISLRAIQKRLGRGVRDPLRLWAPFMGRDERGN